MPTTQTKPACSIWNCDRPVLAKGWCGTHWQRAKNGTPAMDAPVANKKRGTPEERFRAKIQPSPDSDCILWTDHLIKGYGQFRISRGFQVMAHVFNYELHRGPVPEGMVLDHICHPIDGSCPGGQSCRHRRCVNPDHLKPETRGDNARRCVPMHLRPVSLRD